MATDWYVGIGGKARRIVKAYIGVNGKAREITDGYIGIGGKARRFWENIGDLVYKEVSWPRYGVKYGIALNNHIIWGAEDPAGRDNYMDGLYFVAYDKNFTWSKIGQFGSYNNIAQYGFRVGNYAAFTGAYRSGRVSGSNTIHFFTDDFVHSIMGGGYLTDPSCIGFNGNGYKAFGYNGDSDDFYSRIYIYSPDLVLRTLTVSGSYKKRMATGVSNDNYATFIGGTSDKTSNRNGTTDITYIDKNDVINHTNLITKAKANAPAVYFNKSVYVFASDLNVDVISNDMVVSKITVSNSINFSRVNCVATRGHIVANGSGSGTNGIGDTGYDYAKKFYWYDKNMVYGSAQRDNRGIGRTWGCGYWQGRAMFNACDHNESSGRYFGGKMYTFED